MGLIRKRRQRPPHKTRSPALQRCPQHTAIVKKSFIVTPRKPNSARRKVAKVFIKRTKRTVDIYLEGMDYNKLNPHSVVLVRGKGPRDTPAVNYHAIRGKGDFPPLLNRRKGRSKYGVKNMYKPVKKKSYPSLFLAERVARRLYLQYGYSNHGKIFHRRDRKKKDLRVKV